jgi:hypothetical protein
MKINEIMKQQGWELVERQGWITVLDQRPDFRASFTTNRVGKIVDTHFYVTLQLPKIAKETIEQLGRQPISIKSTNGARDATYWGFDTKDVSDDDLKVFASRLNDAIDALT